MPISVLRVHEDRRFSLGFAHWRDFYIVLVIFLVALELLKIRLELLTFREIGNVLLHVSLSLVLGSLFDHLSNFESLSSLQDIVVFTQPHLGHLERLARGLVSGHEDNDSIANAAPFLVVGLPLEAVNLDNHGASTG